MPVRHQRCFSTRSTYYWSRSAYVNTATDWIPYSNDSSRIERGEDLNKIENDVFP